MKQVFVVRGLLFILLVLAIVLFGSSNRWCWIKYAAYDYRLNEQMIQGNINPTQFEQARETLKNYCLN